MTAGAPQSGEDSRASIQMLPYCIGTVTHLTAVLGNVQLSMLKWQYWGCANKGMPTAWQYVEWHFPFLGSSDVSWYDLIWRKARWSETPDVSEPEELPVGQSLGSMHGKSLDGLGDLIRLSVNGLIEKTCRAWEPFNKSMTSPWRVSRRCPPSPPHPAPAEGEASGKAATEPSGEETEKASEGEGEEAPKEGEEMELVTIEPPKKLTYCERVHPLPTTQMKSRIITLLVGPTESQTQISPHLSFLLTSPYSREIQTPDSSM
ncbi:hypothetical protein EX30DRAFT_349766 [Ascodesmis nigricans]|uniref:Uncharacterized protein n=1 Tax=Ascodesmis nigricans TaxID=341454 RepID=A0A4S2MU86_9PEZI|nr:hypothetical protein EX30DRAFT_349766 [Ascodesmis nigricans]